MFCETKGIVISSKKQWWLKVNTKVVRRGSLDGAIFPYIIKCKYIVDGKEYTKRKWIKAGREVPQIGSKVTVMFNENKPSKAKIYL